MSNLKDRIEPLSEDEYKFKGEEVNFVTISEDNRFRVCFKRPDGTIMITPPALSNLSRENLIDAICDYYASHKEKIRDFFEKTLNWDIAWVTEDIHEHEDLET